MMNTFMGVSRVRARWIPKIGNGGDRSRMATLMTSMRRADHIPTTATHKLATRLCSTGILYASEASLSDVDKANG